MPPYLGSCCPRRVYLLEYAEKREKIIINIKQEEGLN
jgi:hypothetical protein